MIVKYWLVSALLAFSMSALAQSGVSVKTVSKAGILHNQFQGESLDRIKVLKLKGLLNKQDIKFINNELHVSDLDLSEAFFDSSVAKEGHFPGYLFEKLRGSLQRIVLSSAINHLDDNAFTDMSNLECISFRAPIYTVGKSAFKGCGKLVIDGNEFKEASLIDDYAFYECSSIQSILLGKTVNKMGLKAFWGCKSLQKVEIEPNNEELLFIPEGAFYNCESLKSVDIPTLVKSIDKSSFTGCRSLSMLNMRTIIPPMLADNAFDETIPPMSVVVSEHSFKLYKKSSNWRKFREYLTTVDSRKLYDKDEKEERIRPTVIKKEEVANVAEPSIEEQKQDKKDTVLAITQKELAERTAVSSVTVIKGEKKGVKQEKPVKADVAKEDKKKTPAVTPKNEVETPVVVTNKGSRTPVLSVPDKKQEDKKDEREGGFAQEVRENTDIVPYKPTKYYGSPIVNQAVSGLTLYEKNGMVHIEAPAKIKQLTIIDNTGRTIYANRLSDTLYSTSVVQTSIKLIRAVYENGIETKRFQ